MTYELFLDIFGYASSIVVLISLSMKSAVQLRIWNAFGSGLFATFAFLTQSYPTSALNGILVAVDLYYLYQLMGKHDAFDIVEVNKEDALVRLFCKKNKKEMDAIFGEGAIEPAEELAIYFRNNDIAGLVAFTRDDAGTAHIFVDYVTPTYRDCAVGKHFFVDDLSFWRERNIKQFEMITTTDKHTAYLAKIGFKPRKMQLDWTRRITIGPNTLPPAQATEKPAEITKED